MRLVERHTSAPSLRFSPQRLNSLNEFLTQEIEDALAARSTQESVWRDCLQLYEGVPKLPIRNTPIENAPNIEIVLGAIAADSIYAQALDMMFQISPTLTVRDAGSGNFTHHAKGVQTFANWGAANEWNLRAQVEQFALDDIQLGSGIFYVPFVQRAIKTSVYTIKAQHPSIFCIAPEDFLAPGGATDDLQTLRWCAPRFWYTSGELEELAQQNDWDVSNVIPVGNVGWVRSRRETLGRTVSSRKISELYEIYQPYIYFDIDEDGIDEDLLVTWDRTSRSICKLNWTPFDKRPFEVARYQKRAHLFYGMGVIEMLKEFQRGVTEFYNWWACNALLSNARFWVGPPGAFPQNARIWPNKQLEIQDPSKIQAIAMSDTYQSMPQAIAVTIGLAERRVGMNEMSTPRPSQVLGSRTPGITAMSMLQQTTRRFTPAFDDLRGAAARSVAQCLYRYHERLLAGDLGAERTITEVVGNELGRLVVDVLKRDDFDRALTIELTASSASINREADRQNAVILMNLLGQYYEKLIQLSTVMANPQVPEPVRKTAGKIAEAAGEAMDRVIRTFDQIRDPRTFIVSLEDAMDQRLAGQLPQGGLEGLSALLGGVGGGNGGQPALAGATQ